MKVLILGANGMLGPWVSNALKKDHEIIETDLKEIDSNSNFHKVDISNTAEVIDAAENIDTGDVWKKITLPVKKHALWNEINHVLFQGELELMTWAIQNHANIVPEVQDVSESATYWPRRTAKDSRLAIEKSIKEQFDLLRICDPDRYPAYFEMHGRQYKLRLEYYDEE